jgi:hypothetical protein
VLHRSGLWYKKFLERIGCDLLWEEKAMRGCSVLKHLMDKIHGQERKVMYSPIPGKKKEKILL